MSVGFVDVAELFLTKDSKVFKNLIEKKKLIESSNIEHKKIRPLLIVMGGSMRGVIGGAQASALNEFGLQNVFDMAIGVSAGAPIMSYFLTGLEPTRKGTSIFYEELSGSAFIDFKKAPKIEKMQTLRNSFEKGKKKLDIDALISARTDSYIVTTDAVDGHFDMHSLKENNSKIMDIMMASAAVPYISDTEYNINGSAAIDGSVSFSISRVIETEIVKKLDPTDIIVITNQDNIEISNFQNTKEAGFKKIYGVFSHQLARLMLNKKRIAMDLGYLFNKNKNGDFNVGIFDLPNNAKRLGNLTTNKKKLRSIANQTLRHSLSVLGAEDLYRELP